MSIEQLMRIKRLEEEIEKLKAPERGLSHFKVLEERMTKLEQQYRALNARTSKKNAL